MCNKKSYLVKVAPVTTLSPFSDNKSQSETRRRKRRWSGGQSVPQVPTGSTAPYCDLACVLGFLHKDSNMNIPFLDVRELPSNVYLLEHKKVRRKGGVIEHHASKAGGGIWSITPTSTPRNALERALYLLLWKLFPALHLLKPDNSVLH